MRAFYSGNAPDLNKVTEVATVAAENQTGAGENNLNSITAAIDTGLDVTDLATGIGVDGLGEALSAVGDAASAVGEGALSLLGAIGELLGGL